MRGMYVEVFSLSMVNSDFILSKRARDQVIYCPFRVQKLTTYSVCLLYLHVLTWSTIECISKICNILHLWYIQTTLVLSNAFSWLQNSHLIYVNR